MDFEKKAMLEKIFNVNYDLPQEKRELLAEINRNNKFDKSAICAPYINGTACVGKSTLINRIHKELIKEKLQTEDGQFIIKPSQWMPKKSFEKKDESLTRAMAYQMSFYNLGLKYLNMIGDRCPLNNFIWRFILMMIDHENENPNECKNSEKYLVDILNTLPQEFYDTLEILPIIILVNTNIQHVKRKMMERNEGNDRRRASIEGYIRMQNIVYMAFAYLGRFKIYDLSEEFDEKCDLIKNDIIDKIRLNVELTNFKIVPIPLADISLKRKLSEILDESKRLKFVKRANILK